MKYFLSALALPIAMLFCAQVLAPSAAAKPKVEDRKLCSDATEDPTSLLICVKSLNQRLSELEDEPDSVDAPDDTDKKITALEDQLRQARAEIAGLKTRVEAAGKGGEASSMIIAPFRVVDEAGAEIFAVTSAGGEAKVVVGSTAGNRVTLSTDASHSVIASVNGEQSVILNAGGDLTAVTVSDPSKGDIGLGHISTGFSGLLYKKGDGGELFNLGVEPDKGSALRLFSGGKPVAAIGSNISVGGAGALFIGNGLSNAVAITSDESSAGSLNIFAGGQSAAIELRGADSVIGLFENGVPVASLVKSPNSNGGNVTLYSPGGDGVFSAGATTDGGGEACVTRQNGNTSCLGIGMPGMGVGK